MYYLKQNVLGKVPKLELTEMEFLEIKNAKISLRCALAIEEKFEIVSSNLKEFEEDISSEAGVNKAFMAANYKGSFGFRILLERRLANLLTSTKTYVDQLPTNARDSFIEPAGVLEEIKKYFNEAYDSSIDYRIMEMLRNHVQHNGIAIHTVQHNSKRTDHGFESKVVALSKKSELVQNKKNKKLTLNEMEDTIDLLSSCRNYVSKLALVHRKVRQKIEQNTYLARKVFEDTISRYEKQGGNALGLNAFHITEEESTMISILLDFDDIRVDIQKNSFV